MNIETCFCGYAAFLMGHYLRASQLTTRIGKFMPLVAAGSLVVLLILDRYDTVGMGSGNIGSLPFFTIVSLCGWFLTWCAASLIKGHIKQFLRYCGENSIWIAMLHFLAFKPVAWFYLVATSSDLSRLSAFPVYPQPRLWVPYTLSGVLLPLLLCACVHTAAKHWKSKGAHRIEKQNIS